jgi:RNA polymerase sigma factor (sigma-70 family)
VRRLPADLPLEHLLREFAPQVLGTLLRRFKDFGAAEDAVQEALIAAAAQWPQAGQPENPRGWLTQVAIRRMSDYFRRESARRRRESEVALESELQVDAKYFDQSTHTDDTLDLLFVCCHPSLSPASAIPLTLRAVGGLTTAEIARAFLLPESTVAQRISRAKTRIKSSSIPFARPTMDDRVQRLDSVLHVLYLIFSEGYTASAGPQLRRGDLSDEAIRLTRIVFRLERGQPEAAGLLALMLLTDARRLARVGDEGELISLAEQNRSLWDQTQIAEGVALISATLPKGTVGPYQIQAAIAAVHDEAASAAETDWPQILALYDLLGRMTDNPMVALNQAIATAMVHGAKRGLELVDSLLKDVRLSENHRLNAVRGHLLELAGDFDGASRHYRSAAMKTGSLPERNYLLMRTARSTELAGLLR